MYLYKLYIRFSFSQRFGIFTLLIGLCSLATAFRSVDLVDTIQEKFNLFYARNASAKLVLSLNQSTFLPGDTIFFSARYLDENNLTIKGHHIAQLDLVNPDGKTEHRILFKIKEGAATNQVILPVDLLPSNYRLIASTDLIRSFENDLLLWKEVHVIKDKSLVPAARKINVKVYAEGGKIIKGVSNKVLVKGPGRTRYSVKGNGGTEIIAEGELDKNGTSTFSFTPTQSAGYALLAEAQTLKLDIVSDGVAVEVESSERCKITFRIPEGSVHQGKELATMVTSKGKVVAKRTLILKAGEPESWTLPLAEGMNFLHQLYLFDASSTVLAERIFVPIHSQPSSSMIIGPDSLSVRDNASFSIKLTDNFGNPQTGNLAVNVYQKNLFSYTEKGPVLQFLDLPELDEWLYNNRISSIPQINNFLLSQQWTRIDWKRILFGAQTSSSLLNTRTSAFKGTVQFVAGGASPRDSLVVVSYLQKNALGFETSVRGGKFSIPFDYDFWERDYVFLNLLKNGKPVKDPYTITLSSDSMQYARFPKWIEGTFASPYATYQFNKGMAAKSYSFFGNGNSKTEDIAYNPNRLLEEELNGPDFSVNVSEYIQFSNMEELLREVVPFVLGKKKGDRYTVRMSFRYETTAKVYRQDPLYIIDGFMTQDTELFMSLSTKDVLYVKLINNPNKLMQLGKLGQYGVIFVQTKNQTYDKSLLEKNLYPVLGLSEPILFSEESYTAQKNYAVPDLRSTLAWNPNLHVGPNGITAFNFATSDDIGLYTIQVNGITKDGVPILAERDVKIVFKSDKN